MKTYIWKIKKGYYCVFEEELDPEYWAGQIGTTYEDFENGKWVLLSDELTLFHENYPEASVIEVWNTELILVPEKSLELAKEEKLQLLYEFDSSSTVNGFIVNGIEGWFTAAERTNFRASLDSAKLLNIDTLSFFVDSAEITIPTAQAEIFLALILHYADECFMVTKRHELAIKSLNTVDEVENYQFTDGYPAKLVFTIE